MSGRTVSFEIHRTTSAPPATLFRLETDVARWADWQLISLRMIKAAERETLTGPTG